jgi:surfactin synthase thioesterase subunit
MPIPPSVQLLCLPHAGSSALSYARWRRRLPAWLEVTPVELPGRARLMGDALETSMPGLIAALLPHLPELRERPFALFGHSLGALVAFELAHCLESRGLGAPLVLFASGAHAPSRHDTELPVPQSDAELRAELERLGGTPALVLADAELMALALPVLRADFALSRRYTCEPGRRIACPIHVLGGSADETSEATLRAWGDHTRADCSVDVLPGGHFFIHEQEAEVLELVRTRLRALLLARDADPEHLAAK